MVTFTLATEQDTLPSRIKSILIYDETAPGRVYIAHGCPAPHSLFTHLRSECADSSALIGYVIRDYPEYPDRWAAYRVTGDFLSFYETREAAGADLESLITAAWPRVATD